MLEPVNGAANLVQVASFVPRCGEAFARLLSDADAKIVDNFLEARLWLAFRSRHEGRMSVSFTPLHIRSYFLTSEEELRGLIKPSVESAVAEHAAYWQSKVWC
jgi:hypothetical protein